MAGDERSRRARGDEEASRLPPAGGGVADVRDPLPREIRDPSFPASVRGYDRHAVDAYVERINRLIAELQVSGSPRAAVRHALDRVGEQTSGILQRAREAAEEITTSAREEAEETTARAKAEAEDVTLGARRQANDAISRASAEADEIVAGARAEADEILVRAKDQSEQTLARARIEAEGRTRRCEEEIATLREQAEARMRSLRADIAAVSEERLVLLDEVRRIAARLEEVVVEAAPADQKTPAETPGTLEPAPPAETDAMPPGGRHGGEPQDERPEAAASAPEA